MNKRLPLFFTLCLLWGCNQSADQDQADVNPLPLQGELLDSALEPVAEAPSERPIEKDVAPEPPSKSDLAAQAAGTEELDSPVSEKGGLVDAQVASATPAASASDSGKDEGEYKFVAFDTLAGYEYFLTPMNESSLNKEPPKDQIPKHIRALDGQKVIIEGYMVPIDVEGERIKSFILTNSMMMCCYGAMPWINEWIFVEMENEEGAGFYNDVVIRTKGIIEVGEEIEDGMVISLYRMKGRQVDSTGEPIPFLFGN